MIYVLISFLFFFSSRRRHTRCALVTGVQTCALPIWVALVARVEAVFIVSIENPDRPTPVARSGRIQAGLLREHLIGRNPISKRSGGQAYHCLINERFICIAEISRCTCQANASEIIFHVCAKDIIDLNQIGRASSRERVCLSV